MAWAFAAALASVTTFGCTLDAATQTATPSAIPSVQAASHRTIDIEDMVKGAGAIVIGTVVEELEPSLVPRHPGDGLGTPIVADRYRNFAVEVEQSYVPGVATGTTIAVMVENGIQRPTDPITPRPLSDLPGFAVGERLLLFLWQVDRYARQHAGYSEPEGFRPEDYYRLAPTRFDGLEETLTVGHMAPDGDGWAYWPEQFHVAHDEFEALVAEHAHVVRPGCLGFWTIASFAIGDSLEDLVQKSDVVIKGRLGPDIEIDSTVWPVEVLEVLAGSLDDETITIDGYVMHYRPDFASCDYIFFLRAIENSRLGGGIEPYSYVGSSAQGIVAVDSGRVQDVWAPIEGGLYRGMAEEEFVAKILEAAEQAEVSDG